MQKEGEGARMLLPLPYQKQLSLCRLGFQVNFETFENKWLKRS